MKKLTSVLLAACVMVAWAGVAKYKALKAHKRQELARYEACWAVYKRVQACYGFDQAEMFSVGRCRAINSFWRQNDFVDKLQAKDCLELNNIFRDAN